MALISNSDYENKLTSPGIKGLLPAARNIALSRPEGHIATGDIFCALVIQEPELMARLKQKFDIDEEKLKKRIVQSMPLGHVAELVDDFEEMPVTPRVDAAFRRASIGRESISRRDLLRGLLEDDGNSEIVAFLIDLGAISTSFVSGKFRFEGFSPTGRHRKKALMDFVAFMLEEPEVDNE